MYRKTGRECTSVTRAEILWLKTSRACKLPPDENPSKVACSDACVVPFGDNRFRFCL